jgi:small subunit ribosomal protein S2
MAKVSMKKLLESGVHFGHRTHRWNPYMKPYIFTERNGIHIIDLQQTVKSLEDAYKMVRDLVAGGGTILFVGTKRQAQETIMLEAERAGMPYVTNRWLGGMMTNWVTMRGRVRELDKLERERETGEFERLTKKEGLILGRKINKLEERFGGIRSMHRLPDMLFIVDVRREETAVDEANSLDIPILALVDTNCDPRQIDHVIPSNDDAIRAIKLMVAYIADAVLEGKDMRKDDDKPEEKTEAVKAPAKKKAKASADETEVSDEDLLGESTLAKMEAAAEEEEARREAEAKKKAAAEAEALKDDTEEELPSDEEQPSDGDASDGDASDGDASDGDASDEDASDESDASTETEEETAADEE